MPCLMFVYQWLILVSCSKKITPQYVFSFYISAENTSSDLQLSQVPIVLLAKLYSSKTCSNSEALYVINLTKKEPNKNVVHSQV